jgi:hypothetical protein
MPAVHYSHKVANVEDEKSKQLGGPKSGLTPKQSKACATWGIKILIIAKHERAYSRVSEA